MGCHLPRSERATAARRPGPQHEALVVAHEQADRQVHLRLRATADPDRTLVPTDFERAQAEAERAQAEAERADDLATRLARNEAEFGPLDEA